VTSRQPPTRRRPAQAQRYVHRVAIANSRIRAYDGQTVTFSYKDRADGGKTKSEVVSGKEFCQRFVQHVLPERFVRIRHYGFLAACKRKDLARCRELLGAAPVAKEKKKAETWVEAYKRIFHRDPLLCPRCKVGQMLVRHVLPPLRR
jgi:hypothetical protein